jgi:methyl-accepting chemotaxis protein
MNKMTIRLRLLALVSAMLLSCTIIGVMGLDALSRSVAGLNTVYLDRVVPLRDLKNIADLFAVKIVDSSHKVHSGQMTYAQAEKAVRDADSQINTLWAAYQNTRMSPEEKSLVVATARVVDAAQEPIERLKGILQRSDKTALDTFVKVELYQFIDPISAEFSQLIQIQLDESKRVYDDSVALYNTT